MVASLGQSKAILAQCALPNNNTTQRTMEQDFRPFSCETCSKRYLRKNNLEDHVLMEHPDSDQVITY